MLRILKLEHSIIVVVKNSDCVWNQVAVARIKQVSICEVLTAILDSFIRGVGCHYHWTASGGCHC